MASEIKIHLVSVLDDAGYKATDKKTKETAATVEKEVERILKKRQEYERSIEGMAKRTIQQMDKQKAHVEALKNKLEELPGPIGKVAGEFLKAHKGLESFVGKGMAYAAAFKVGWDIGTWINDKVITPLFGVRDAEEELKKRNRELKQQAEAAAQAWDEAFKTWEDGFKRQVDGLDRSISKAERLTAAYLQMQQAREKVQKAGDDASILGMQRDKFNSMAELTAGGNAVGAAQTGKYYDVLIAEEKQKQKLAKFDRDAESLEKRRATAQQTYAASQKKVATIEQELIEAKREEARLDSRDAVKKLGWVKTEEKYQKAVETREKLEKDLAAAQAERDKRRTALGALNVEASATAQERANLEEQAKLEVDEKKKAYDDYLDEVAKKEAAAEEDRVRAQEENARKVVEAEAQERRRMEAALAQQRLADVRAELDERKRMESEAASAQAAASSKLSTAWGYYRNQASMQAAIDENRAQKEAEVQWAKDFERLKSRRRDWRTAEFGTLSAADESVRQVALAKEEKEAADRAVIETAENTRQLAEKLDELLQVKG